MEENFIIIEPITKPRADWEKSFIEMRKNGDDELLIQDIFDEESKWV
jgi:antitoxin MazE